MKIIITEEQNEKLNRKIKSTIEKYGIEHAMNLFGDKGIIKRIYQNNPSEFLDQFNDLTPVEKDDRIYYVDKDRLPLLREAGHYMEPVMRFDGSLDHNTQVVDFYVAAPDNAPVADEDWTTWKQLDVVKLAQKHWADQAVSVTVYYRKEELPALKAWLADNLKYLKTISFLCHSEHGFKQAPKETITKEQYEKLSAKIRPIDVGDVGDGELESTGDAKHSQFLTIAS